MVVCSAGFAQRHADLVADVRGRGGAPINLQTARTKAAELLGDAAQRSATPDLVDIGDGITGAHPFMEGKSPSGFTEPELLYFALTQLLDFSDGERGDKGTWSIPFEYKGIHFAFEFRKSGLRFMCEHGRVDDSILGEVHGRARGLADLAARHLAAERVPAQLQSGDVTIPNYFDALERRYRFFREEAEPLFAALPIITAENAHAIDISDYFHTVNRAGAFATACIDAYFSRVDHLLVLSLAFIGDVVHRGDLLDFLQASWKTKARKQLKPGDDPTLAKLYEELLTLRREWRNPWAHGGFKSGGASFYFHVPGVGALPVTLSKSNERQIVDLMTPAPKFKQALDAFDAFDQLLERDTLRYTYRWARSGLDLAVDADSREQLRAAMSSPEEFEALIEGIGRRRDVEANVEF